MKKSESIASLSAALIQFQAKLTKVKKDGKNPHFGNKYASLSQIIESIQAPLTECGLAIVQMPEGENNLETILVHTSGEWIAESYTMRPTKNDPQGVGSAITYQRRYALGSVLCLNIDEDDDGNKASVQNHPLKKQLMPDDRFANMINKVKEAKSETEAIKLIVIARNNFILTKEQENTLNEWHDNVHELQSSNPY